MNANEFAIDFVEDLNDTLKHINIDKDHGLIFNNDTYEDDPNLEILKTHLNKVGYDLILKEPNENKSKQEWHLKKL